MFRALKLFGTFAMGSAVSKALVFLLLPLYTRVLEPSAFGTYDVSITYGTLFASLVYCEVWVATMRSMYAVPNAREKGDSARLGVTFFAASTLILGAMFLIAGVFVPIPFGGYLFGYTVSLTAKDLFGYIARGLGRDQLFAISGVVHTIVMIGMNYVLLLRLGWGIEALYVASICASLVQVLIIEVRCRILCSHRWGVLNSANLLYMVRFALPLGLNAFGFWFITGVGKFVIQAEAGVRENGLYAVGTKLAAIVIILSGVLAAVWQDAAFTRRQNDSDRFYWRALSYFLVSASLCVAFTLVLVQSTFSWLVGEPYRSVYSALPLFFTAAAAGAVSSFLGNSFYAIERSFPVLITTLIGAGSAGVLSIWLTRAFSINGANLAAIAAFSIIIVGRLIWLRRYLDIGVSVVDLGLAAGLLVVPAVCFLKGSLLLSWMGTLFCLVAVGLRFRTELRPVWNSVAGRWLKR